MADQGEVTRILRRMRRGGAEIKAELIALVYDELRRLANYYMQQEPAGHTLRPTALVHEAYVRLLGDAHCEWIDRVHFFSSAARAMRHVLVDYARKRKAEKRGGDAQRLELDEVLLFTNEKSEEILALEEALTRLERMDPTQAQIVELRFFSGFTVPQVAQLLSMSTRTVEREWELARRWLYREMSGEGRNGTAEVAQD